MPIAEIESRELWDGFFNTTKPNTFLHSWEWGEFQLAAGERIWRLGLYEGDLLRGVALIIRVRAKRGSFLFCPHGPILNGIKNHELRIKNLIDYLKPLAKDEKCSFIRFSPLMPYTPENNALWHGLGFRDAPMHMHPELAWILNISADEQTLLGGMRKTTRHAIRKAEKDGVQIVTSVKPADIELFWQIYGATVNRQHFVPFSKKYLRREFEVFAAQRRAALIFGKYQGKIISAAFIVFTPESGFYHHGASVSQYPNITASQLVQWHGILEAKRRGCAKYNFWGIAPEGAKKHPWHGLSVFKKGFGGYAEEYMHARDLPLTPNYWIAYAVEKVRKIRRGL